MGVWEKDVAWFLVAIFSQTTIRICKLVIPEQSFLLFSTPYRAQCIAQTPVARIQMWSRQMIISDLNMGGC